MRAAFGSAILGSVLLALGCGDSGGGPATATVNGTVRFDGQPVEEGSIKFQPTGAGPTGGGTIKGGKYEARGVAVGGNKVEIVANRKTGKKVPDASRPGTERDELEQYIPAKYNDKTELIENVKSGTNAIDFELTSK